MKQLKTVDIKGKSYVMVNERISYFREAYPNGSIITELLSSTDGVHTFKAIAINDGNVLATGHASEKEVQQAQEEAHQHFVVEEFSNLVLNVGPASILGQLSKEAKEELMMAVFLSGGKYA